MDTLLNIVLALAAWAVLVRCGVAALSDWQARQRDTSTPFAASMARWGGTCERRGR